MEYCRSTVENTVENLVPCTVLPYAVKMSRRLKAIGTDYWSAKLYLVSSGHISCVYLDFFGIRPKISINFLALGCKKWENLIASIRCIWFCFNINTAAFHFQTWPRGDMPIVSVVMKEQYKYRCDSRKYILYIL